ncbi:hypothetical protein Mp_2g16800 [Marchantia polymorpha subsp. ruderalis]|uniref:Uncharacterized protein n=1 Tax=Marchantia polymorpha TaxID=3197 RepID=A0A2R6WCM0_MARPO|nr:hypothetical protein MARPO_0109s0021 [Marchantia polymorpha]BBN02631.1 hypothetical protein Mp_2g16800 [Marchantia polymorpha subsp. ruderalis]|eukprot:PTQ31589.1 hypothetical protein MARPO_0109s0021 [Marchantia polymorpha]
MLPPTASPRLPRHCYSRCSLSARQSTSNISRYRRKRKNLMTASQPRDKRSRIAPRTGSKYIEISNIPRPQRFSDSKTLRLSAAMDGAQDEKKIRRIGSQTNSSDVYDARPKPSQPGPGQAKPPEAKPSEHPAAPAAAAAASTGRERTARDGTSEARARTRDSETLSETNHEVWATM